MRRKRVVAFLTLLVLVVAGLGATTASGSGTAKQHKAALTTINVGVIPISAVAPLYLGIQKGFFAKEGLDVKPQPAQGGAAIIPAVLNGSYQIGFSGIVPMLMATSRGLKIRIVSNANAGGDTDGVVVAKDSPITKRSQLAGKTIAVNTLGAEADVTIRRAAIKEGIDPNTFKWVEIPFPDMLSALQQGRVDAIWQPEPFLTIAENAGARVMLRPYGVDPMRTTSAYFTSQSYLDKHPDIVAKFVRASNKSLAYADAHYDQVRQVLVSSLKVDPSLAQQMHLPLYPIDLNVPSIKLTAKLMKAYGLVNKVPNVNLLLPQKSK